MNREQRRAARVQAQKINQQWGPELAEIPRENWPVNERSILRLWRSKTHIVMEFAPPKRVRDSVVCRLAIECVQQGRPVTQADMQRIKRECGFPDHDAVLALPGDVNLALNPEHGQLWVLVGRLPMLERSTELYGGLKAEVIAQDEVPPT